MITRVSQVMGAFTLLLLGLFNLGVVIFGLTQPGFYASAALFLILGVVSMVRSIRAMGRSEPGAAGIIWTVLACLLVSPIFAFTVLALELQLFSRGHL